MELHISVAYFSYCGERRDLLLVNIFIRFQNKLKVLILPKSHILALYVYSIKKQPYQGNYAQNSVII